MKGKRYPEASVFREGKSTSRWHGTAQHACRQPILHGATARAAAASVRAVRSTAVADDLGESASTWRRPAGHESRHDADLRGGPCHTCLRHSYGHRQYCYPGKAHRGCCGGSAEVLFIASLDQVHAVLQIKTAATDGYNAVQVGYEGVPERKITKPELNHLKKADAPALRHLREFKVR